MFENLFHLVNEHNITYEKQKRYGLTTSEKWLFYLGNTKGYIIKTIIFSLTYEIILLTV